MKYELKQGNNLVTELSTSAYEPSKKCLHELLYSDDFEYAVEKRDNLDLNGANVDSCYKIYNKKADGSCRKMQTFVVNFYHTTSQILISGSKMDIFISTMLDKLCAKTVARCSQLDIMNINIASALNSAQNNQILTINDKKDNTSVDIIVEPSGENVTELDDELSDNEACEICPICGQQAYGKVVQYGECGDWYHYDCMNINDGIITDKNEKHNDNSTSLNLDNTQNTPEKLSQTGKIDVTNDTCMFNPETDPKMVNIDSEPRSKPVINSVQNNKEYTSSESSATKT